MSKPLGTMTLVVVLSGCMNLSGYDGNASFGCKAPDGVICTSMTGVYENARQNNLPGQQPKREATGQPTPTAQIEPTPTRRYHATTTRTPSTGDPLRTGPTIQRIWIAPWADADNDLHDVAYLYVVVDPGDWSVEHHRNTLRQRFGPVLRAPATLATDPTTTPRDPEPIAPKP